jgi:hypothetical protein
MTNYGVVVGGSSGAAIAGLRRGEATLDHRPNLAEPWTYVETGDPELDTPASPPWTSDIYFVTGAPIAFRCGLDGQLDMIGSYDLSAYDISGGPVADDAFTLPFKWRSAAPPVSHFPVEIGTDIWIMAVQTINLTTGVVRIAWPTVAPPMP